MYRSTVWQLEAKDYTPDFGDGSMHRLQWALFSKIDDPSVKYIIINLHYPTSKNAALQTKAAGELNELFKSLKEQYPTVPISVTGDYNTAYGSAVYNASVADTDLKTSFLATRDKSQAQASIDHILVEDDDVTVFAYRVVDNGHIYKTSDHRPVFADIAYGKIIIPTPGPDVPWEEGEPQ